MSETDILKDLSECEISLLITGSGNVWDFVFFMYLNDHNINFLRIKLNFRERNNQIEETHVCRKLRSAEEINAEYKKALADYGIHEEEYSSSIRYRRYDEGSEYGRTKVSGALMLAYLGGMLSNMELEGIDGRAKDEIKGFINWHVNDWTNEGRDITFSFSKKSWM